MKQSMKIWDQLVLAMPATFGGMGVALAIILALGTFEPSTWWLAALLGGTGIGMGGILRLSAKATAKKQAQRFRTVMDKLATLAKLEDGSTDRPRLQQGDGDPTE